MKQNLFNFAVKVAILTRKMYGTPHIGHMRTLKLFVHEAYAQVFIRRVNRQHVLHWLYLVHMLRHGFLIAYARCHGAIAAVVTMSPLAAQSVRNDLTTKRHRHERS